MNTTKSETSLRNKRERSPPEKDDDNDILPLSKRMNCLNLNDSSNETAGEIDHLYTSGAMDVNASQQFKTDQNHSILNRTNNLVEGGDIELRFTAQISKDLLKPQAKIIGKQAAEKEIQNSNHIGIGDNNPQPGLVRYEPAMDKQSNPLYYEPNRLLFYLYLERISRNRIRPHPDLLRGSGDAC